MVKEVSFFAGGKLFEANHGIAIKINLGPQSRYFLIRSALDEVGDGVAEVFLDGLVEGVEIGHVIIKGQFSV